MLNPEAQRLVDRLIEVAISDSRERIAREKRRIREVATKGGALGSSRVVVMMWEALQAELAVLAQGIADAYIQVLAADPSGASAITPEDVRAELDRRLPPDDPELREHLDELGSIPPEQLPLAEVRERAITRAVARFDLWRFGVKRTSPATGASSVINVSGPVGSILTGSHASATVHMAGQEERAQLVAALDRLAALMERQELPPEMPRAEVLDLVAEVRQEVQKLEPNGLRVAFLGSAVAGSVQTVAALQPAYQAIRAALSSLGVPNVP